MRTAASPTAARIVARRNFHLFVIPEDIVFIAPQFRGSRCFVFEDELVIVDPFTFGAMREIG
jgi:hypothetical protein